MLSQCGVLGGETLTLVESGTTQRVVVSGPLLHSDVGFSHPHPRYKKYGTRCSSCWLVPRKSVQPKKLCGRCGVSLGPHQGPTQEG